MIKKLILTTTIFFVSINARIPVLLKNPLYRCWMNSTIQMLYQIEPLNQLVLQRAEAYRELGTQGSLAAAYSETIRYLEAANPTEVYDSPFCMLAAPGKGALSRGFEVIFGALQKDLVSQKRIDDLFSFTTITPRAPYFMRNPFYWLTNPHENLKENLQNSKTAPLPLMPKLELVQTSPYFMIFLYGEGKCAIDSFELDLSDFFVPLQPKGTSVYQLISVGMHTENHATAYVNDDTTNTWYFMNDTPKPERIKKTEEQMKTLLKNGIVSEDTLKWTENLTPSFLIYKRVTNNKVDATQDIKKSLEELAYSLQKLQKASS